MKLNTGDINRIVPKRNDTNMTATNHVTSAVIDMAA